MTEQHEMRALVKAVRRIARAFDVQSRRIDRAIGLTLPQLVVLTCVGEMGRVTSRAIAAEAGISAPTVVAILDRLEAKGLVIRTRSDRDRRVVHPHLTDAGRALLAEAPAPLGEGVARRFGARPPAERAAILSALGELGALLESEIAEPGAGPDAEAGRAARLAREGRRG